ncbi:MAG TPA: type II toxin-antitoxin system RelE/ParE family toxin [Nitrospirae bacterium]|nr:plasmid stabilization system protein [bacterium BMS3Bbin09]HDO25877.1 type II toxin-antitoxin system RelE/ParE family toxin [Nitrospirota bacterium]
MEIKYSEKAVKQFKKIHKGDRKSAAIILQSIETYAVKPSRSVNVKVLKGKYGNLKRLRAGNYRIIFEDDKNVILIYEIKHRQEAYHD